jgi:hypothetical protein
VFQKGEERRDKKPRIGPDQGHAMPGGKKGEGLLEQLDAAIGRAGSAHTERGPQQATRFTQESDERMMRGARPRFCGW